MMSMMREFTALIALAAFTHVWIVIIVMAAPLKGWRYVAFISGIVGFIGVALYPIIIYPLQNIETYSK